jgi:hypothetical protein
VAVVHGAIVVLALVAVPLLPCILILIVRLDEVWDSCCRASRRRRRRARERRDARRLLRAAGVCRARRWHRSGQQEVVIAAQAVAPIGPVGPPVERLAADLRRLSHQRVGPAARSPVWHSAVQRAYDARLTVACRELEISQHFAELTGVDLEIERVRVEGMLQQAGLTVRDTEADLR